MKITQSKFQKLIRESVTRKIKEAKAKKTKLAEGLSEGKILKESSDLDYETLSKFVELAAESSELELERGTAEPTEEVLEIAHKFSEDVDKVLEYWFGNNQHHLADGMTVEHVLEADPAYNVLMTLRGEGVGIWDGRWDEFFANPKRDIPELMKFLKGMLSGYADDTGGGKLNQAFDDAAFVAAGELEEAKIPQLKEENPYKLPYATRLPTLVEPGQHTMWIESDQQIVWSENKFEKETELIKLQDFDLKQEHLVWASFVDRKAPEMATRVMKSSPRMPEHNKIWGQAKEEFEKSGGIKGSLFQTPNNQKVWLSHYDINYLEKLSENSDSEEFEESFGGIVEAGKSKKTEHSGAKKGDGGYWGKKKDAKKDSNKARRSNDKKETKKQLDEAYGAEDRFEKLDALRSHMDDTEILEQVVRIMSSEQWDELHKTLMQYFSGNPDFGAVGQ